MLKAGKKTRKRYGGDYIVTGLLWGLLSALLLLFLASALIYKEVIGVEYASELVIGINTLCGLFCGFTAALKKGEGKLKAGLLAGLALATTIALAAVMIDIDNVSLDLIIRIFACSTGGSLLGSIFKFSKSNKKFR